MALLNSFDLNALDVKISELLVATADGYDHHLDGEITQVLQMLRHQLRMDVVFVSEFCDGRRVFRFTDGGDAIGVVAGESGPLEESYCKRVVEGRVPELIIDAGEFVTRGELPPTDIRVGAHLSTPVVLHDGSVYGTLCCFSALADPTLNENDLRRLKQCARLVARKVDIVARTDFAETEPDMSLTPVESLRRRW